MAKYREKLQEVEASQWLKDGDHPAVRSYGSPHGDGLDRCQHCNNIFVEHGWIDIPSELNVVGGGQLVCPGDWIIQMGRTHYPCKAGRFEQKYEPVEEKQQ